MKRYLFLFAVLLNTLWVSAQYSGSGNGTENDPYLIYNETQLYQMNNFLGSSHAGVVFKLMKDLDLTEFISENFPSEGWMAVGVESSPFQGKFYGNNHTLSGLWISRSSTNHVGLFGYISGATIKDLNIESTNVLGETYVGTLVGYATESNISNCHATGTGSETVTGVYVGGLAGYIGESATVSNCSFEGVCVKSTESSSYAGGLVGSASLSTLSNCNASTSINAQSYVGGIAGFATQMAITDCNSEGDISATSNAGGVFGQTFGTSSITNCRYQGNITANTHVGGIGGNISEGSSITFTNSHSKGKITNDGDYTGGIVGVSNGGCIAEMENCSHFGDICGKNYVGGLVGAVLNKKESVPVYYLSKSSTENTRAQGPYQCIVGGSTVTKSINNCTAIGNISGQSYIGGLFGKDEYAQTFTYSSSGGTAIANTYVYYNSSSKKNVTFYYKLWRNESYIGYSSSNYIYPGDSRNLVLTAITNSYYSGNIEGSEYVGGIAGYKEGGSIQNCYTYSTSIQGTKYVGGIIGSSQGTAALSNAQAQYLTLKSNVAINSTISASSANVGRIYGYKANDYVTIGALASKEGNRALTTTKVIKQGVVQEITDDLQNGNVMGKSLLKLKANYVALGWDFDNNWDILETECYPYKKYQAAPPVIESNLVSQDTEISGSSLNGGTVYLYYKDREAVSTTCNGNAWTFSTDALQSGAPVQLYADVDDMTPSYLTSTTVGYPGSGTESDPYRIYTAEDLQGASNKGYYKLMNDIDLSAWINENSPTEGWVAVGRNSGEATYINGDGHKITGLWINTTQDYTGLFSNFSTGIIKNLTVEVATGKKVKGVDYTGVLIGRNANGQIINCTVKGDVEGTAHVGGVTGYSGNNTINSVSYEGTVNSSTASAYVGGFAGLSENDNITAVQSYAAISASGANNYVGGAIGYLNGGTITKSHAENALTATGESNYVGGLVGYSKGDVTLSYTTGTITASGATTYTGGLVGLAYNPISNCYSTAKTTGTYYTAGLCAYSYSTIDKCYAKGDVYGSRYGGGVVAQLDGESAALTNSIAANNTLELTDQSAWGTRVIGGFKNGAAEPDESNYALSTMQVSLNGVAQKKTDDAVEGIAKSSTVLMSSDTYIALGWDYSKVWSNDEGQTYPYLLWEVDVNPVTEITLDNTSLILAQGNTSKLTASVMPLGATNKRLEWKSSNTAVATVADGEVTAVGIGTADITATSTDGSNIVATCKLTVVANKDAAISELQTIVDAAQTLYDNSSEGDNIGQYEAGARTSLLAVIRSVKTRISSTMSDDEILSCTNDINNAVAAFKEKQVKAGEDTDITLYENVIYVENKEAAAGQQITLSLKMNNTIAPTGFQCDVYLPDGISVAKDEDDFCLITLSTTRTSSRKTDYFASKVQTDGTVRILASSTQNYTFSGNEGEVANITLNIDGDIEEGEYPIIIKNIVIADAQAKTYEVDYVKSTLTISSYTLGDANNDGKINVGDFSAIASHIIGTPADAFVEKAADINGDGNINVGDMTGLATLILGGTTSTTSNAKAIAPYRKVSSVVSVVDCNVSAGKEFSIDVNVGGEYKFSGYQFDLVLPDGISVKTINGEPCVWLSTERTDAFATDFFTSRMTADNKLRVLSASTSGAFFDGTSGSVAHLTLVADENTSGDYTVNVENTVLAANMTTMRPPSSSFIVHVGETTGIDNLDADSISVKGAYDLTGRKVSENAVGLKKGIYIINGKKVIK